MYHPLTPGQSWVQSPVSFRREGWGGEGRGVRERKRGRNIAGDEAIWANKEVRIRLDVEKSFKEGK